MKKALLVLAVMVLCVGCVKAETKFYPKNGFMRTKYMEVMNKGGIDYFPEYEKGISMDDLVNGICNKFEKLEEKINLKPKEYIGEVYKKQIYDTVTSLDSMYFMYSLGEKKPDFKWEKFRETNITNKIDGYTEINSVWYKNEDIIWYDDIYKSQKAVIEQRIKAKGEVIK